MKVGDVVRVVQGPLLEEFGGMLGTVLAVNRVFGLYPIKANFECRETLLSPHELEVVSVET